MCNESYSSPSRLPALGRRPFWSNHMTRYCSNFSDSLVEECLKDDNDATTVALNFLMRYKPLEPDMHLQAFGRRFDNIKSVQFQVENVISVFPRQIKKNHHLKFTAT